MSRILGRLTFDMRGGPKGAKRPLERPLDGRVRHLFAPRQKRVPDECVHVLVLRPAPPLDGHSASWARQRRVASVLKTRWRTHEWLSPTGERHRVAASRRLR